MFVAAIILIVIIAVLLVLVILAQNPKGGGISSQFGGSGASQLMGAQKTGDFMEKMTWGLAVALIAVTLSTKFLIAPEVSEYYSPNLEEAEDRQAAPSLGLPEEENAAPADSAE